MPQCRLTMLRDSLLLFSVSCHIVTVAGLRHVASGHFKDQYEHVAPRFATFRSKIGTHIAQTCVKTGGKGRCQDQFSKNK